MFPNIFIQSSKINLLDLKLSQYIPIHQKLIRDLSLSSGHDEEILLSCGLDKKITLTNLTTNRSMINYDCGYPIW